MIDITPYTDSLNALKDYMWYWICWQQCEINRMNFYKETGMLLHNVESFQTFDKWREYHGWRYES